MGTTESIVNIEFANEVKRDRINALWKITMGMAGAVLLFAFAFVLYKPTAFEPFWMFTPLTVVGTCFATRFSLRMRGHTVAAWVYSVGLMISLSIGMLSPNPIFLNVLPFAFTVVVVLAGLMLPPLQTVGIAMLSIACIFFVPLFETGGLGFFGAYQVAAVVMVLLAAGAAAQATGELYAVTEWALMNYKRERRANSELFDNRLALEKSLKRSEALSDRLKEINNELEAARASAESAKHFRGQFLANMSHELRTPLNAIIGFSETMRKFPIMYDNIPLPEAYANDLDQIYNSGKLLLNLINDILDLAKIDAGKLDVRMSTVEIRPIITGVMSTANGLIGDKPVKLASNLPDPLPRVYADPNRLRQILLNLYSNAVKFTDQGIITLSVQETEEGVQFSLKDTGSGISPENQQLIFEEFKQGANNAGRDPRSGSGLGLSITRQLLTLMNGRIWVESEVGVGSTFHFVVQTPPLETENSADAVAEQQETVTQS